MNDKPYPKIHISAIAVLLAGACVALPVACSDDDRVPPISEGGSGGETSSGGNKASGGSSSGGQVGSGGTSAGGGPSNGGASSGGASSGGASSGGASSGGAVNTGGGVPDGGDEDGGDDGGAGCSGPTNANSANLCLTFQPEGVQSVTANPQDFSMNNVGTLVVFVYNKEFPTSATDGLVAQKFYPAQPSATTPPFSEQVAINQLPKMGFSGLPDTVYVRALFVDNPNWFKTMSGLTWGMQVGGVNLNSGIRPSTPTGAPAIRAIALTKGEETASNVRMTALKKFTTTVALFPGLPANPPAIPDPIPATVPADDGQGILSVGVFDQLSPANAFIFGGVEGRCVNVVAGPITGVEGFFYTVATLPTTMYFGAQVNDFNTNTIIQGAPGGALISLTSQQTLPTNQKATVAAGQYSITLDVPPNSTAPAPLFLTAVNQVPDPRPPSFQCPPVTPDPVDAGND